MDKLCIMICVKEWKGVPFEIVFPPKKENQDMRKNTFARLAGLVLALTLALLLLPGMTESAQAVSYPQNMTAMGFTATASIRCAAGHEAEYHTASDLTITSFSLSGDTITISGSLSYVCNGATETRTFSNYTMYYGGCTSSHYQYGTYIPLNSDPTAPYDNWARVNTHRKAGHLVTGGYTEVGDRHTAYCTVCGDVDERCSGGTATCLRAAVCAYCGGSYGSTDANVHDTSETYAINDGIFQHIVYHACCRTRVNPYRGEDHTVSIPADCEHGPYCAVCETYYNEGLAKGHLWETGYSSDENVHWHACSRSGCQERKDEGTHSWKATYRSDATGHYRECSTCGYKQYHTPSWSTATCTTPATCATCNLTRGTTDANNHGWSSWSWNSGSTQHKRTCSYDPTHVETGDCNHEAATCLAESRCTVCTHQYAAQKSHEWQYAASGAVITETCPNGCGHEVKASLTGGTSHVYTGSAITPFSLGADPGWEGGSLTIQYQNNIDVGTATGSVTVGGATASKTFAITAKPLTDSDITVTLSATEGVYTGGTLTPTVIVRHGASITLDSDDITVTWPDGACVTPGTYTATISAVENGNYSGQRTVDFTVTEAALTDVQVKQTNTLTYNGKAQTPAIAASATSVDGSAVTFTYATEQNGTYTGSVSVTDAGSYTIYYKASAANHEVAAGAFTVTVNKQPVTPPTIASKVYTGQHQSADIAASPLYTVTENEGGTEGGYYDVVLTLTDPVNYSWPNPSNPALILTFTITPAENAWKEEPTITGWTYGQSPTVPTMGSAVYGSASVKYVGTTNAGTAYESTDAPTVAGSYEAVFTVAETASYSGLEKKVSFTVARAALPTDSGFAYTEPTDLVYNGKVQSVSVTTTLEGVAAEDMTLNYSAEPKNAGAYTFTLSVAQSDNYLASAAPLRSDAWKFAIAKAQPVISWSATTFTYNAQPQGAAGVTLVNGETYSGTVAYTNAKGGAEAVSGLPTDAGTYTVTAAIAEQANYLAATAETTLTVNPKPVTPTVVLTPDTYTYDGEAKQPAVKVMDGSTEIPAAEYIVSYSSNTAVGAANVSIAEKSGGNYTIAANTKGVFLILPDASALEGVTASNVTDEDKAAITAIQNAMSGKDTTQASASARKTWNDLAERCEALQDALAEKDDLTEKIEEETAALPEQPKTTDLEKVEELLEDYEAIQGNLTEAEKEALKEEIQKLEELEETLKEVADTLEEIEEGVEALDPEELEYADKATISDLQEKIDDVKDDASLTDADKAALEEAGEALEELLKEFEEADKVSEQLNKLPATASPDNTDAMEDYAAAKKLYEDLGEDKAKVDPAAVKKLNDLGAALLDYKIIQGNGARWVKYSNKDLSFTANGYFPKFVRVRINGAILDPANYTVKSGSTIVTLNASYMKTLKTGTYNISIVYEDGCADGTFRVVPPAWNPKTGDQIMAAVTVMAVSAAAIVVLLLLKKRKK